MAILEKNFVFYKGANGSVSASELDGFLLGSGHCILSMSMYTEQLNLSYTPIDSTAPSAKIYSHKSREHLEIVNIQFRTKVVKKI
jgi:hypothetical protein